MKEESIAMRKDIQVHIASNFAEAEAWDDSYYLSMSASARLETIQFLREEYKKLHKGNDDEGGKRLRRVLRLIKPE